MLSVLAESLALASGGILSVGSITIVILLLTSGQEWRNGLAYVLGYVGAYSLIGVSVVLVGYGSTDGGSSAGGVVSSVLTIGVGLLLLWLARRNWRKPASEHPDPPRLFAYLDGITPVKALAFGAMVTVLNFKNLAIFLSAVSVSLSSELPLQSKLLVVLLVVLVFCASVIAPLLVYVAFPQGARERLIRFKQALETHSRPIGIWLPAFFGLLFLIRGMTGMM